VGQQPVERENAVDFCKVMRVVEQRRALDVEYVAAIAALGSKANDLFAGVARYMAVELDVEPEQEAVREVKTVEEQVQLRVIAPQSLLDSGISLLVWAVPQVQSCSRGLLPKWWDLEPEGSTVTYCIITKKIHSTPEV
jgi:hypothetical protein